MAIVSIISNEGAVESTSAVLEVTATNPEYNQPALHVKQASKRGGAASIRIDDPNPDIELIETDQVAPAGKYKIAVQSDKLQINGRNASVILPSRPLWCFSDWQRVAISDSGQPASLRYGILVRKITADCDTLIARVMDVSGNSVTSAPIPL